MVKLRLCPECSQKLNYHSKKRQIKKQIKEVLKSEKLNKETKRRQKQKKHKKRKESETESSSAEESESSTNSNEEEETELKKDDLKQVKIFYYKIMG